MDMQSLFNALSVSNSPSPGIADLMLALVVAFVLGMGVAKACQRYSGNPSLQTNFLVSIPLFSMLCSSVTLLIGANIARAFGLVGALSLIRFRTAIKEPLDVTFLFWAMAIGMASGSGQVMAAFFVFTLGFVFLLLLRNLKFGEGAQSLIVMKVCFSQKATSEDILRFEKQARSFFKSMEASNFYLNSHSETREFLYTCAVKKTSDTISIPEKVKSASEFVTKVELFNQEAQLCL